MKTKRRKIDTIALPVILTALAVLLISLQMFKIYKLQIYSIFDIREQYSITPATNDLKYDISKTYTTSDVDIEAEVGIVYDVSNDHIIWQKGDDSTLYAMASITKVMTAYTAMHNCGKASITVDKRLADEGLDLGLADGDIWSKEEAIKYMLTISSNDMANIIANACGGTDVFVENMNENSKAMNLEIKFYNPSGLDMDLVNSRDEGVNNSNNAGSQTPGAIGSTLDIAKMLAIASKEYPQIFDATTYKSNSYESNTRKVRGIANTNEYIANIRGAELSKTGTTDLAGGNLGIVYDRGINQKIVIVVLNSSKSGRFVDVQNLYKFANSL